MKSLILPKNILDKILSGEIRQVRGKQTEIREYTVGSNFKLLSVENEYKGLCKALSYTSCKFLALPSYEYESNESLLDFIENYLKIHGPTDILNESIGILNFLMIEDSNGNSLSYKEGFGYDINNTIG